MPSVCPEATPPKQEPIHALCDAYREPTDSARQAPLALRLDDQMQMILLH